MTTTSPSTHSSPQHSDQETDDEYLGWEGHVHMSDGPSLWSRILKMGPDLRTGLAFSLVFTAGTIIGCSLATLFCCQRQKSTE